MTDDELIEYYADLLIMQYVGKPKAYAHIQALVKPVVMNQLGLDVQNAFDIETAIGVQLDVLGKYAGVTRYGSALDGTPIELDDDDFRQLIKMATIRNSSGSSLYEIQILLQTFFPNQIYVYENSTMQLSYFMSGGVGSIELAQMFLVQNLFPKPMGVQLSSLVYLEVTTNLFGFQTYERQDYTNTAFTTYEDGFDVDTHFLQYEDTVEV